MQYLYKIEYVPAGAHINPGKIPLHLILIEI